ncbi:beta-ketoacyl synthase N-terminal-like domain-containing protein [Streptomyces tendae]|uniref:beta-ketoacyl synthase N-terminal-like domain-containing protein n=1 Tax=Streptomyces tendae TaxID=1932 RepID=UPI0037F7B1B2
MTSTDFPAEQVDFGEKLAKALDMVSRLRGALEERDRAAHEPIAVVGMSLRFPGAAQTPEAFWNLLRDGVDAVGPFPADRWDASPYVDPEQGKPGKAYVTDAGYVATAEDFDASLFGISPPEALGMDPQQRMVLEGAWAALEHAGIAPDSLQGSGTGVFIGASTSDYVRMRQQFGAAEAIDSYQLFGENSFIAGRVCHTFGLHGPAQVVDTACSSSLTAVHQAMRSLRSGETELALAGGVNAILAPYGFVLLSQSQAVAPDGRCKTFDASANGYGRGEGCGIVVLKRLSDARRDGDRILAVLRGSALNHDGRAGGISVPNGSAQQAVIRAALADARVSGADIGYVEAHGTGTVLGDPTELHSMEAVLGAGRNTGDALLVGSAKTNIGHLEAAAGIAGLIKAILVVRHGEVPPNLHFHTPNPMVEWHRLHLRVPTETVPWPAPGRPRLAGVSSFGASGTNAHVVVEQPPAPEPPRERPPAPRHAQLLALSARTPDALRAVAARYAEFLEDLAGTDGGDTDSVSLRDVCHNAHSRRAHQAHRVAVVGDSPGALAEQLRRFADKAPGAPQAGKAPVRARPKIAFLFSGQGSQYAGMANELYATEPVFRNALDRCAELLGEHLDRPLLDVLFAADGADLDRTRWTQPALFSVEYALARLWISWGIRPAAVMGHSVGEITAACVAGVLTLEDAVALIAVRGRAMDDAPPGAMLAVPLSEADAVAAIGERGDSVSVAAVNGPQSAVLSGPFEAVEAIEAELAEHGIRAKRLKVSHAFHSPMTEAALPELARVAESISPRSPSIPLVSNVTGELADAGTLRAPDYWCRHARGAVRFHEGLETLKASGVSTFLEVGPGRVLLGMGARAVPDHSLQWLASLRPGHSDAAEIRGSLARLYLLGAPIAWPSGEDAPARWTELPVYPFQRQRYSFPVGETIEGGRAPAAGAATTSAGVYGLDWQPAAVPVPLRPATTRLRPGRTLLLADASGTAELLAKRLEEAGDECLLCYLSDHIATDGDRTATEQGEAGSLQAVADFVRQAGPLDRIVHMWGLDTPSGEDAGTADVARARALGPEALAQIVRSLARPPAEDGHAAPTVGSRLWVVTRGAQATGEESGPATVAAAPLIGLGKTIALEHPGLWGGSVDLDPDAEPDVDALAAVVLQDTPPQEDQIVLRGGRPLVPRLVRRTDADTSGTPLIRPDAVYLITGGLGGVGMLVAGWLVDAGARHLVLTGRTGLPERARWDDGSLPPDIAARTAEVRALEERGADVRVVAADVCDEGAMHGLLAELREGPRPLAGVVHAAGLSLGQDLAEAEPEPFREVLRPKTDGAWLLHEAVGDLPLDFFALMSSVASVWGAAHLGAFTAANQFLDALAAHRRSRGLPAATLNWGRWDMVSGLGGRGKPERVAATGFRALDHTVALAHLGSVLAGDETQRIVAEVDWEVVRPLLESQRVRPVLTGIDAPAASAPEAEAETDEVFKWALDLPAAEREAALDEYVWNSLSEQLAVPRSEFTGDFNLLDFGYDSLGAMRTLAKFRQELHLDLDTRQFFEISADEWGRYLATSLQEQHG